MTDPQVAPWVIIARKKCRNIDSLQTVQTGLKNGKVTKVSWT
jgi:hypothetical protein